jgi:digeranylgeranylglycerophospholipid reductase
MKDFIEDSYDVLVIGGGPAGSAAAMTAAKAGLSALIVEKRAEIGCPKRCGEGLSMHGMERMELKKDDSWAIRHITGTTAYAPNGRSVNVPFDPSISDDYSGWIIERKMFDKMLADRAANSGAKILTKTEAVSLLKEDGKVCGARLDFNGEQWDVKAKVIIAADGVESKIAREAGIDVKARLTDFISAAQFEMSNIDIDPDSIELYFGTEAAPGGYVWIFPKGEHRANVGIGVRKPWAKKRAIEYLKDFINSRPDLKKGSIIEVNAGGVPVGGFLDDMVTDNFMIVGDAAHQVNPIHGGGIAESFIGGRMAAEVAAKAIKQGNTSKQALSEYNKKWWDERGNSLKKLVKLREVVESLSDDDLNFLADNLEGADLVGLARAKGFKKLAGIMMKRPKLILLARKLL